jgi:hypothetical protein
MRRISPLSVVCVLLVIVSALALSWFLPINPDDAVAESALAGMVATGVAIVTGRFPI